ncbi:ECF-type sigma factor [Planctomyces sp. SH-PL14]|uniref:ECF-type sigma factor n=1 Tax=Planctomyces sp. SH-PL14 TaxID=1632864 RepID=UPI000946692B|nr:ECF-type sigma factor [Planctomyces sp. SH-PL14]
MSEVTAILAAVQRGERQASDELIARLYAELRALAAAKLSAEPPGQTIQATALVHEAYLRLVGDPSSLQWDSRGHFFAAAAESMRRILVDRARQRSTKKHGGDAERIEFDEAVLQSPSSGPHVDLELIDNALTELELQDEPAARLVKLRYFAGLSHQEAAEAMGMTRRAADRLWVVARAWLFRRLQESI